MVDDNEVVHRLVDKSEGEELWTNGVESNENPMTAPRGRLARRTILRPHM